MVYWVEGEGVKIMLHVLQLSDENQAVSVVRLGLRPPPEGLKAINPLPVGNNALPGGRVAPAQLPAISGMGVAGLPGLQAVNKSEPSNNTIHWGLA